MPVVSHARLFSFTWQFNRLHRRAIGALRARPETFAPRRPTATLPCSGDRPRVLAIRTVYNPSGVLFGAGIAERLSLSFWRFSATIGSSGLGGKRESKEPELIDRALAGDQSAFAELVRQNQDRLFASMLQVTGSPEEAEEVAQETFIRAYLKLSTFQRNSQFFTWIYRIAFNNALTRRRKKRAKVSLDQFREESGLEIAADSDQVDESLLRDERVLLVREAIETLTDEHRGILVLREMEEFSYEEIAEVLEISIGTVRSRLSRARRALRTAIENKERESK